MSYSLLKTRQILELKFRKVRGLHHQEGIKLQNQNFLRHCFLIIDANKTRMRKLNAFFITNKACYVSIWILLLARSKYGLESQRLHEYLLRLALYSWSAFDAFTLSVSASIISHKRDTSNLALTKI